MVIESSLALDSGLVSSPVAIGGNTLTDSTKSWATNVHRNRLIKIVSGLGVGQLAVIDGNASNTLIIRGFWPQAIGVGVAYVILSSDLAQILQDVFGGGSVLGISNPLPVDVVPGAPSSVDGLFRLGIQGSEQVVPGGVGRPASASMLFYGFDGIGSVPADQIWVDIAATPYAELIRVVGMTSAQIYSKMQFKYPHFAVYTRFPTLVGSVAGTSHYLGLENGASAGIGLTIFIHNLVAGVDTLLCHCNHANYNVTTLIPADWMTALHYWGVKINRLSADFFCDGVLLATIASDIGLLASTQTGDYGISINSPVPNRAQASVYAVFIGIEGGAGPDVWPVSKFYLTLVETDPDTPRVYNLMDLATLVGGATSTLANILPVIAGRSFAITVTLTYNGAATAGSRIHLRTSYDGTNYDTEDWDTWAPTGFVAGVTIRQTKIYDNDVRFVKVLVENLDAVNAITDINITATVRG